MYIFVGATISLVAYLAVLVAGPADVNPYVTAGLIVSWSLLVKSELDKRRKRNAFADVMKD